MSQASGKLIPRLRWPLRGPPRVGRLGLAPELCCPIIAALGARQRPRNQFGRAPSIPRATNINNATGRSGAPLEPTHCAHWKLKI